MLVPDVNILVSAEFHDLTHHRIARTWLRNACDGDEVVGIPELVLSAFVRISTNQRVFTSALVPELAFRRVREVLATPAVVVLHEGPRHWELFERISLELGIAGPHVSDAYLAAFAIENNATFVTFDRGFQRFPALRVLEPA
ncbi:MAG: PIN domain-containing protein [Dehalococcoidia bacterium]|nr:PIN domain-containing protein [Dehalococcoidia bacterium]